MQREYLYQLGSLLEGSGELPWFIAGDVLHKWDSEPELLSFLIRELPPHCHAVPGNHDLPHHRYAERKRSGYWTLVEAGSIRNLAPDKPHDFGSFMVRAFPEGYPLAEPFEAMELSDKLKLAVVHHYVWTDKQGSHPGAAEEDHVTALEDVLCGYDAVVFGDNHMPFLVKRGDPADPVHLYNHGTFVCRRSDEKTIRPQVGWLMSDGSIGVDYLNNQEDRWVEDDDGTFAVLEAAGLQPDELLEVLRELGDTALSFKDAVLHYLKRNKVGEPVQRLVIAWLEKVGNGKPK